MDRLRDFLESEKNLSLQPSVVMVQSRLQELLADQMIRFAATAPTDSFLEFIFENAYDQNDWHTGRVAEFFSRLFNTLDGLRQRDSQTQLYLHLLSSPTSLEDVRAVLSLTGFLAEFKNCPLDVQTNLKKVFLHASEVKNLVRAFPLLAQLLGTVPNDPQGGLSVASVLLAVVRVVDDREALVRQLSDPRAIGTCLRRAKLRRALVTVRTAARLMAAADESQILRAKLQWSERLAALTTLVSGREPPQEESLNELRAAFIRHFTEGRLPPLISLAQGLDVHLLAARDRLTEYVKTAPPSTLSHLFQLVDLKLRADLGRLKTQVEALGVVRRDWRRGRAALDTLAKDLLFFGHFRQLVARRIAAEGVEVSGRFERNEVLDKQLLVFLRRTEAEVKREFEILVKKREQDVAAAIGKLRDTQIMDDIVECLNGKGHKVHGLSRLAGFCGADRRTAGGTQRVSARLSAGLEVASNRAARAESSHRPVRAESKPAWASEGGAGLDLFAGWNRNWAGRPVASGDGEEISQAILRYAQKVDLGSLSSGQSEAGLEEHLQRIFGATSAQFFGRMAEKRGSAKPKTSIPFDEVIQKESRSYLDLAYTEGLTRSLSNPYLDVAKKSLVTRHPSVYEEVIFITIANEGPSGSKTPPPSPISSGHNPAHDAPAPVFAFAPRASTLKTRQTPEANPGLVPPDFNIKIRNSVVEDQQVPAPVIQLRDVRTSLVVPDAPVFAMDPTQGSIRNLRVGDLETSLAPPEISFKKPSVATQSQLVHIDFKRPGKTPNVATEAPQLDMNVVGRGFARKAQGGSQMTPQAPQLGTSAFLKGRGQGSVLGQSVTDSGELEAPVLPESNYLTLSEVKLTPVAPTQVTVRLPKTPDCPVPEVNITSAPKVPGVLAPQFAFEPKTSLISEPTVPQASALESVRASLAGPKSLATPSAPLDLTAPKISIKGPQFYAPEVNMSFVKKKTGVQQVEAPVLPQFWRSALADCPLQAPSVNLDPRRVPPSQDDLAPPPDFDWTAKLPRNSFTADLIEMPPKLNVDFRKSRKTIAEDAKIDGIDAPKFEWKAKQSLLRGNLAVPDLQLLPRASLASSQPTARLLVRSTGMSVSVREGQVENSAKPVYHSEAVTQSLTFTIESGLQQGPTGVPLAPAIETDFKKHSVTSLDAPQMAYQPLGSLTSSARILDPPSVPLKPTLATNGLRMPEAPIVSIRASIKDSTPGNPDAPEVNLSRIILAKKPAEEIPEPPQIFCSTRQSKAAFLFAATNLPETSEDKTQEAKLGSQAPHLIELRSFHRATITRMSKPQTPSASPTDQMDGLSTELAQQMRELQDAHQESIGTSTLFLNVAVADSGEVSELRRLTLDQQKADENFEAEAPAIALNFRKKKQTEIELQTPPQDLVVRMPGLNRDTDGGVEVPILKLNFESLKNITKDELRVPNLPIPLRESIKDIPKAPLLSSDSFLRKGSLNVAVPAAPSLSEGAPRRFMTDLEDKSDAGSGSQNDSEAPVDSDQPSTPVIRNSQLHNPAAPPAPIFNFKPQVTQNANSQDAPALDRLGSLRAVHMQAPDLLMAPKLSLRKVETAPKILLPASLRRKEELTAPEVASKIFAKKKAAEALEAPLINAEVVKAHARVPTLEPLPILTPSTIPTLPVLPKAPFGLQLNFPKTTPEPAVPEVDPEAFRYQATGNPDAPTLVLRLNSLVGNSQVPDAPESVALPKRYSLLPQALPEAPQIEYKGRSTLTQHRNDGAVPAPPEFSVTAALSAALNHNHPSISYSIPGHPVPDSEYYESNPNPKNATPASLIPLRDVPKRIVSIRAQMSIRSPDSQLDGTPHDLRTLELQNNHLVRRHCKADALSDDFPQPTQGSQGPLDKKDPQVSKVPAKRSSIATLTPCKQNETVFLTNCATLARHLHLDGGRPSTQNLPKSKLVFWEPIEPANIAGSIWERLQTFPQTIQFRKLQDLFKNTQNRPESFVADPDRLKHLNTVLDRTFGSQKDVAALEAMFVRLWMADFAAESLSTLDAILAALPLQAELVLAAQAASTDLSALDFASKWILVASAVPHLEARLRGQRLQLTWGQFGRETAAKLAAYGRISAVFLDNRDFQKFAKACLDSGNTLNHRTTLGGVPGFRWESLAAFCRCTSEQRVSLLEYLVFEFAAQDKAALDTLRGLAADSRLVRESPLALLVRDIASAKTVLNQMRLAFEATDSSTIPDQIFAKKFKRFYATNAAEIITLEATAAATEEQLEQAVGYLGETAENVDWQLATGELLDALGTSLTAALAIKI